MRQCTVCFTKKFGKKENMTLFKNSLQGGKPK